MKYIKAKRRDMYLGDMPLENIFINEFLPIAPGDFVKVYLYARLYAEIGYPLDNAQMSKELAIDEKTLIEAWEYWEDMNAIKKRFYGEGKADFAVEFIDLKELIYGGGKGEEQKDSQGVEPVSVFGSEAIPALMPKIEKILGRTLSSSDMQNVISWIDDVKATPEVVEKAVVYCSDKGKVSFKYIEKVIEEWTKIGIKTSEDVDNYLEENDQRHVRYRRVMKALGFSRNPSEEEQRLMDSWFDEMGFKMDKVLEACSKTAGISNPNLKYVNSILDNWRKEASEDNRDVNEKKPVSRAVLNKYYDFLRKKAETDADARRKEIYKKLPKIKEIEKSIHSLSAKLSGMMLYGQDNGESKSLNDEMNMLYEERAIILTENNYDMDYMEERYKCNLCDDTGIMDTGERCSCIEQRMIEAEEWQSQREKRRKN